MARKTCDISTRDFPISDANPHSEDKKENRLNTTLYLPIVSFIEMGLVYKAKPLWTPSCLVNLR